MLNKSSLLEKLSNKNANGDFHLASANIVFINSNSKSKRRFVSQLQVSRLEIMAMLEVVSVNAKLRSVGHLQFSEVLFYNLIVM